MKKAYVLLISCLFAGPFVFAQKPEMAQAVVHYKFSHIRDTANRDKPYTENMVLFLGPTSSAYKSYDRKMQDALMRKQVEQQVADQKGNGGPMNIKITNSKPTTRTELFQYPLQKKMVRKESLITPYLIEEPLPIISWKISSDTASFSTLHCQKATGHFGGRDYTAWFCPDLPYHAGPWKLSGLPGLIVEAYDTNKEVVFKFDGLEEVSKTAKPATTTDLAATGPGGTALKVFGGDDPNQDPNLISLPTDAVKTTEKEFKNLQEAMRKDPQAFMASMGGGARMTAPPAGGGVGGGPQVISINNMPMGQRAMNNPLELPEKK